MSTITYRLSAALSAALLILTILAVPASATHVAGLPDDPLDCTADPVSCLTEPLEDPLGGVLPVGGVLPGVGGGLPNVGGGLPGVGGGLPGVGGGLPGTGGLPPVLPPDPPSGGETPSPPDGAPAVVPPAVEQEPVSRPAKSRPEPADSATPSAGRVVAEPAYGRTTSTGGGQQPGDTNSKSRSRGAHSRRAGSNSITGDGPSPPPSTHGRPSDFARASSRGGGVTGFAGGILHRIPEQYRWPVFVLACLSTFFALNTLRERFRSMRAEGRALTDALTELPNRLAFERALAREYRRADRYDRPLSMLLLDLDGFKQINDRMGHAAGDEVLRKAAAAISSRIRSDDLAARLGGDEFVVLCPETSAESARELARMLEETLAQASIRTSIGVAEREAEDDGLPEYLVARADAAMYQTKKRSGGGRDRRTTTITPSPELAGLAAA